MSEPILTQEGITLELPGDRMVEEAFIVSLFSRPGDLSKAIVMVSPEMFLDEQLQAIYTAMCYMHRKVIQLEPISVCTTLVQLKLLKQAGGKDYVQHLAKVGATVDIKAQARVLVDYYARRQELEMCDAVAAAAFDQGQDMSERSDAVLHHWRQLQQVYVSDVVAMDSRNWGDQYLNEMQRRETHQAQAKLHFQWYRLQHLMPSLHPGTLVGLLGIPGSGKTSMMEQQAETWWQHGFRGVLYHLENPAQEMLDRRVARRTGIPLKTLQDGHSKEEYLTPEEYKQVLDELTAMEKWSGELALVHCPRWTMSQIIADIQLRYFAEGLDYVMVDYFNKIKPESRKGSYLTYDLGQSLEDFKSVLEELGLVGFMAGQMDKNAKGKKAGDMSLRDLRDTGELEDKAQVGIVIGRDRADSGMMDDCTFRVVKCNSGREGSVSMVYEGGRFRFIQA